MKQRITKGYIIAGLMNLLGVLLFSKGLTNTYLSDLYPEVFSRFGLILILLWGLAYLAVASQWEKLPKLAMVFSLEKLVYVISWAYWMSYHWVDLPMIWDQSPLTACFYFVYGINDFAFLLLFLYAVFQTNKKASR